MTADKITLSIYAIYLEELEKVVVGTKKHVENYFEESIGRSLMFIDWYEDCITIRVEPDAIATDYPIVTIEVL